MFNFTGTYTDKYQLTMAQTYFMKGQKEHTAIFDYFFRKLPFEGGYAVFAGLQVLLEALENLRFDKADIDYLYGQGFNPEFLDYLKGFRFQGNIFSFQEGEIVFPACPVLTVEATLIEAQLIETMLLNLLNFQTLIATKASRIRQAAGSCQLIDFGLRRAQGPGGYYASRAAIIGGFNATSNVCVGRDYDIPTSGTMAHSFVQSYDTELSAFRDFAQIWPDNCILLVDTYNTLESGVPNAIKVGKELANQGYQLQGIRLDSGDLAYLSKKARQMLDDAGMQHVKIVASNQLDEYVIKSLMEQQAPIDVFGVGTNLAIGNPDAALDGVYKLAFSNNQPRIKLSENIAKITLPYKKQAYRVLENNGFYLGADVVALENEQDPPVMYHPFEQSKSLIIKNYKKMPLLRKVMGNGESLAKEKSLYEIAQHSKDCLKRLPDEYQRFSNPHIYKVGLSKQLKNKRDELIQQHQNKA
ncbi:MULTISPECIES: nicotinate phosphoribosyltransferase [unclassified Legionella]|uniref:nicotinate phosphoribosyltransferase n=1 Tax=unclassified Legionella TaxID=2622702 RepID=UPI0010563AD5|nr:MULTISPECIES: nicotinate phosphoribosyltransferase [unclassified Legionella]MDI9818241.1 nicotinate phosphoribosyltransferase [Legionella sp. PL877]